jgi:hypothetical protein
MLRYLPFLLALWAPVVRGDDAAIRLRATGGERTARLQWTLPAGVRASALRLYRTDAPKGHADQPLATLAPTAGEYVDTIADWTPRYYRLTAVDDGGKDLAASTLAVAVAHPPRTAAAVETFAFWYEPYKPGAGPDASIHRIGNASFVLGPGAGAAADLKKHGMGLLPYVTYYQTAGWAGAFPKDADPTQVTSKISPICFYQKSAHYAGSPPGYVPSIFCRPGNVEYNPAAVQYTTCPNSVPFRDMVLASARQQLDGGAMGFFVDNGYEDDVAANAVCESTAHQHHYGDDLTASDAFIGLLLDVTCEIKRRNPAGVLMVNGGVRAESRFYGLTLGDVCDGQLWESYLRSSYSTPKEHVYAWEPVYRQSVDLEKAAHAVPPRRMFVLSYPWDRDEAFFCYATAKLCDLPWSANLGDSDPHHTHFGGHFGTYPELINLRLGQPTRGEEYGGHKQGDVYVREYEQGIVAVNPTRTPRDATITFDKPRRYRDVFTGKEGDGASATLNLPAESGRVIVWR